MIDTISIGNITMGEITIPFDDGSRRKWAPLEDVTVQEIGVYVGLMVTLMAAHYTCMISAADPRWAQIWRHMEEVTK